MQILSCWGSIAFEKVRHIQETERYTIATLSIITLFVLWVSASKYIRLIIPEDRYPLVFDAQERFPLSLIYKPLNWFKNGPRIIHDAYEKYPGIIYRLPSTDRPSIVLPARFLDEISNLPDSIASNSHATADFFVGAWTTLDTDAFSHTTLETIRTQYISKIGQQVGPASDEADYVFGRYFSSYEDWTPIAPQPKIMRIVTQTIARTIAGTEICRKPEWVESVIGYAQNVFTAAVYLKLVPRVMRPLVAVFTPYIYRIYSYRRKIRKIISPVIEQRLFWRHQQPEFWAARLKSEEMSTVDWLVEYSPPDEAVPEIMAHRLTGVSFGASHTTSNHITNCLFELAADFDRWAPPLREEIDTILGPNMTNVTNADLSKMWKLDSFMKEAQRFHPPAKLSVNRTLLEPYELSSGDHIPKGSHISLAGVPMSMSEQYFADATTFDGFRFERLRRDHGKKYSGLQFTSSYAGSLHFGHGRQMCPGRFMGSLISKLLVIKFLQCYDLKLRAKESRPDNIMFFDMDYPNPDYEVLFRDRKVGISC
ncbi:putative cytochrome P450 [Daldinia vernicosa]|uniref:putative cytochrome P450 n=1 Tax=Daldinia vernicosa TaxID=114800 RepID=UPI00200793B2|nr:putative cytochrome P450 [Daldinia vernicosa]KAI0853706.1 putative cytochrome P450 [Daldinia vernicosa]